MNKGTVRVLDALSLFSRQSSWGVTELSRELNCAKNSAFHALDTLVREGLVIRDVSGQRYQLSHQVINFIGSGEVLDVRSLCRPTLTQLHGLTEASVFLSIIVGRDSVCIDSVQAPGVSVGYSPLSLAIPLHAGSTSRSLLAFLQDDEIERYIEVCQPLRAFNANTIVAPSALWEDIRLVRQEGFARSYQDVSTGTNFLAFPVLGATDRPLAAVTIGGSLDHFTADFAEALLPRLRAVMGELNRHSRMFPATPLVRF